MKWKTTITVRKRINNIDKKSTEPDSINISPVLPSTAKADKINKHISAILKCENSRNSTKTNTSADTNKKMKERTLLTNLLQYSAFWCKVMVCRSQSWKNICSRFCQWVWNTLDNKQHNKKSSHKIIRMTEFYIYACQPNSQNY